MAPIELRGEHILSFKEVVYLIIYVVSKNGNLLIGITAKADGTIPRYQCNILLGIGLWLQRYGEAIYYIQPWVKAGGIAIGHNDVIPLRFTVKEYKLYVFLLEKPRDRKLSSKSVPRKAKGKE
ncbi:MAG: alpha-L-fucosidase [Ignisphaera sp.]